MTNKEFLFNEISDEALASYLIKEGIHQFYNDELDTYENSTVYISPDESEWFIWDDALNATIDWLNEEY